MQYFSRRFPPLLILVGIALLLMGADNQVKSSGTGSITGNVISDTTISPISKKTGSITSGTTNSLQQRTRSAAPGDEQADPRIVFSCQKNLPEHQVRPTGPA
jgi:hypothetical protein